MVIRLKNSKNEINDVIAEQDDLDYWVDSIKMQLILKIGNRKHIILKSKDHKRLEKGLDFVDEFVKEGKFLDCTELNSKTIKTGLQKAEKPVEDHEIYRKSSKVKGDCDGQLSVFDVQSV